MPDSSIERELATLRSLASRGNFEADLVVRAFDAVRGAKKQNASARFTTTANRAALSGLTATALTGTPVEGDIILVKDQTTATQNGIYVASAGTWNRVVDDNGDYVLTPGMLLIVREGSTLADSLWECTSDSTVVGTDNINFARAGGGSGIVNGRLSFTPDRIFAVRAATGPDNPLGASTYSGSEGPGHTVTVTAHGALVIDGVSLIVGDRVLLTHITDGSQTNARKSCGIYTVTVVGNGSTSPVLTRATDFDETGDTTGFVLVMATEGDTLSGIAFIANFGTGIVFGTTAIGSFFVNSLVGPQDTYISPFGTHLQGDLRLSGQAIVSGDTTLGDVGNVDTDNNVTGNTTTINGGVQVEGPTGILFSAYSSTDGTADTIREFNGTGAGKSAPIANATNSTDVVTQLNTLLAYLRLRGTIHT